MKKILSVGALWILLSLLCNCNSFAQNSNKDLDELHKQIEKSQVSLDSSRKFRDSMMMTPISFHRDSADSVRYWENNARNLNALMNTVNENKRKEKQAMWLRIGLGIAFLALGIFGVLRRKKAKTT